MGWTIATYIERAALIALLPIMLVVVYRLIKQELVEMKNDIKGEKSE